MGLKAKMNEQEVYVKVEEIRTRKGHLDFVRGRFSGRSSVGMTLEELENGKFKMAIVYFIYDRKGGSMVSGGEFITDYDIEAEDNVFALAYEKLKGGVNPALSDLRDD